MKEGKILGTYGTMYYVLDMDATVDFYKTMIGFENINASPGWTEINLEGGQRLCFHITSDKSLIAKGGVLIINVKGIREIVEGFKRRGVRLLEDVKEVYPGAYSADLIDQDGHLISLHEGPEN